MDKKIKIKIYAMPMCSYEHIDENGFMHLDAGSTISQVYKKIKLPLPIWALGLCWINYKRAQRNQKLEDGDIVSFLSPFSGG